MEPAVKRLLWRKTAAARRWCNSGNNVYPERRPDQGVVIHSINVNNNNDGRYNNTSV